MPKSIHLSWSRGDELVDDQYLMQGTLEVRAGSVELLSRSFESLTYASMITKLAGLARRYPAAEVYLRTGTAERSLPSELSQLLREDPVAYIRATSLPDIKVVVGKSPKTQTTPLRAGYDALAETIGERVYARYRRGQVESPITGRWEPIAGWLGTNGSIEGERWFGISTQALLGLDEPRYYLPREWNESGPWISHGSLKRKYETFLRETQL